DDNTKNVLKDNDAKNISENDDAENVTSFNIGIHKKDLNLTNDKELTDRKTKTLSEMTDEEIVPEHDIEEYINDLYRPLFDIVDKEVLMNIDILEGKSSNFKGFDDEYATSAYEDLAKILTYSEYRKEEVIINIHQI
ncbi:3512_t:CDS:2, partial [Funneliformis mosseae]